MAERKLKDRPDLLVPADGTRREGRHRPAQLYRFVRSSSARHTNHERSLPF